MCLSWLWIMRNSRIISWITCPIQRQVISLDLHITPLDFRTASFQVFVLVPIEKYLKPVTTRACLHYWDFIKSPKPCHWKHTSASGHMSCLTFACQPSPLPSPTSTRRHWLSPSVESKQMPKLPLAVFCSNEHAVLLNSLLLMASSKRRCFSSAEIHSRDSTAPTQSLMNGRQASLLLAFPLACRDFFR